MLEILSDLKISNCETRHCSVVSVGCPLYSDTQLIDSWQLWRGRAGDALDSVRQDRHYARKVALVTSVMVVILPPIWKLLSLISFINLLFSLVISLKVRRERTQYPPGQGSAAAQIVWRRDAGRLQDFTPPPLDCVGSKNILHSWFHETLRRKRADSGAA